MRARNVLASLTPPPWDDPLKNNACSGVLALMIGMLHTHFPGIYTYICIEKTITCAPKLQYR